MKRSEWADLCWERAKRDLEAARLMATRGFYYQCVYMCYFAAEKSIWALGAITLEEAKSESRSIEGIATEFAAPPDITGSLSDLAEEFAALEYPSRSSKQEFPTYTAQDAVDRLARAEAIMAWVECCRAKKTI